MAKRISKTHEGVLQTLRLHMRWYDGCDWAYQSPSQTVAVLESLRKRGLVVRTIQGTGSAVYTPARVA